MICKHCGKPNHKSALFCIHCREPLPVNEAPSEPEIILPPDEPVSPSRQPVEDFSWSDSNIQVQSEPRDRTGGKAKAKTGPRATPPSSSGKAEPAEEQTSHKEKKPGKKQLHAPTGSKPKKHRRKEKQKQGGALLSGIRAGLGLCGIAVFVMVAYRAGSVGAFRSLIGNPPDLGGVLGLWPAVLLLLAGMVGIWTRYSRAGGFLAGAIHIVGAILGFLGPGYSIRPINWPILSFLIGAACIFVSGQAGGKSKAPRKEKKERRREKERGGSVVGALLIILILLLGVAAALGIYLYRNGYFDGENTESRESNQDIVSFGQRFHLDGLDLVFRDDIVWLKYQNDGSDVFGVPVTIGNDSGEAHTFNDLLYSQFGIDGSPLDKIGSAFPDDVTQMGVFGPGEQRTAYAHFRYGGDGEYAVRLDDSEGNSAEIRLPIVRPAVQAPPAEESSPSSSESSSEPSASSEESREEEPSVSEAPDDVTYTLPADLVHAGITEELTDRDIQRGVRSIRINADGSATVTISKNGYEAARQSAASSAHTYISALQVDDSPIRTVAMNAAMTEAEITVDRGGNERDLDPSLLAGLYYEAGTCQVLEGRTDIHLNMRLLDHSTGEVFQIFSYPRDLAS